MTLPEVSRLFKHIVQFYPMFDGDAEKIKAWHEILGQVPVEQAIANLKRHVLTEKYPPTIAELTRPLQAPKTENDRFHDFMRGSAIHTLAEWEMMRKLAVPPPPPGQRERIQRYGRI